MKIQQLPDGFKNPDWLENELKSRSEADWEKLGQQRALSLFHAMAERVPAYKQFLKKHQVNHEHIKTIADFKTVPTIDKDNGGKTPEQQLVDGLKLIDREIETMTGQIARGELDKLATRGRFLEIRYDGAGEETGA